MQVKADGGIARASSRRAVRLSSAQDLQGRDLDRLSEGQPSLVDAKSPDGRLEGVRPRVPDPVDPMPEAHQPITPVQGGV